MDNANKDHDDHGKPEKLIHIFLDKTKYEVEGPTITGLQLRQLPNPDVPNDRDIWKEAPGPNDVKVEDTDTVEIKNGDHFYTAPRKINPGA